MIMMTVELILKPKPIVSVIYIFSHFLSHWFVTLQLNRLHVQSVNPKWQPADLRYTSVRDRDRGEILLFKLIDWQVGHVESVFALDHLHDISPIAPIALMPKCNVI